MNDKDIVAVCSRSFSKNKILREELLAKYKNVIFNETGRQFHGEELVDFLAGATKAIVALEKFTPNVIARLTTVRVLSKYGVGLDMIDIDAIKKAGIKLGWQSGVNKRSVSELTLGFMLASLRKSMQLNQKVKEGGWDQVVGETLSGKTIGIIGCGNIGKDLINLLKPFDCQILVNDIVDLSEFCALNPVTQVSLTDLLGHSQIVTIHTPLNQSTRHLVGESNINLMSEESILINTARGGVIDEKALAKKLIKHPTFMAAFDVLEIEPPDLDSALIGLPNFICTPHIGGSTQDSILRMGRSAIASLDDYYLV